MHFKLPFIFPNFRNLFVAKSLYLHRNFMQGCILLDDVSVYPVQYAGLPNQPALIPSSSSCCLIVYAPSSPLYWSESFTTRLPLVENKYDFKKLCANALYCFGSDCLGPFLM